MKLIHDKGNSRVILEDDSVNVLYTHDLVGDEYASDKTIDTVVNMLNEDKSLNEIDEFLLNDTECTQEAREIIIEELTKFLGNLSLLKALKHVQSFYPQVTTVIFNKYGQWHYTDDNFSYIIFDDRIDLSLLEQAADSIERLPFIYHE